MARVIAGVTMSIDGFVTDAKGNAGELYPDLNALRDTAYMIDTIAQAGAVLMGRKTFDMGDPDSYVGNYEFQVDEYSWEKVKVQEVGQRTSMLLRAVR